MRRLLYILKDYLNYRGYRYCQIDGRTGGEYRDASLKPSTRHKVTSLFSYFQLGQVALVSTWPLLML
jgi:SNF2 family DNA or RNA helicase